MLDPPLAFTTLPGDREDTTILRLTGPLTLQNLFAFQEHFRALKSQRLIVDMTEVQYIDSAGLGLLMNGYAGAERNGRAFVLAGVTPRVHTLLELTRVHTVLTLYPSLTEAQQAA